jgi:SAM-dependent methyltransferase
VQDEVLSRELEYHEKLYSGFAQEHFARPAVRAFRAHLVSRILRLTGAGPRSRVLSLGCGIGDTELLLAPHVAEVIGVDLSPAAVRQARADAKRLKIGNVRFLEGSVAEGLAVRGINTVIAIFFLHHLSDAALDDFPHQLRRMLSAQGGFYSLDPNRRRLAGMVGRLLVPNLMKQYQTEDERELRPEDLGRRFRAAELPVRTSMYDFVSTPMAGLFPGSRIAYGAARAADEVLVRVPLLQRLGANFEISLVAQSPERIERRGAARGDQARHQRD